MPTPEGRARNEMVFRTAANLMVRRGYAGTSMGDLAEAVGMTKAGLYHHITSKQDLLFQILLYAMDGLRREVVEPTRAISDPEERLRDMIGRHVLGLFDHGLDLTLLFPERRHLESEKRAIITQQIDGYLGLIRDTLQELEDAGRLRELDVPIAANHILQTIAGIARWYGKDSGVSLSHLVEQTIAYNLSAILKAS